MIDSLNSSESCLNVGFLNLAENIEKQKNVEELLVNLDKLELKFPSREFQNFLTKNWSDSIKSIREKIQSGQFSSAEDVKLRLAGILFNMNINLSFDEIDERSRLIDAFNSVLQI